MSDDDRYTAFTAAQFADPYPDGIDHHYWTLARNRILLKVLRNLGISGPALDIGCGRGITVDFLNRHGVQAFGCDLGVAKPINESVASRLRYATRATELPREERESFRAVMLLDVLEHLPSPASVVEQLGAAFPNCSHVIVTVPARQEIWSNYDTHYGHLLRYDRPVARQQFGDLKDFELERLTYLFRLLYPPALTLKLFRRPRSLAIAAPSASMRIVHRALARYFQFEHSACPPWVVGTSLLMVLRRR